MGRVVGRVNAVTAVILIVTDLLRGGRHSRHTVAQATGASLPTADRWLLEIARLPGVERVKVGFTTWHQFKDVKPKPARPVKGRG